MNVHMKKILTNIMATTAISLIVLSVIAACYKAHFLCIETVFQTFGVNIFLHLGVIGIQKIDFTFPIVEPLLSIGYSLLLVLVCGNIFSWYESMPVYVLVLLTMIVYIVGAWLSVIQLRKEVNDINELLKYQK